MGPSQGGRASRRFLPHASGRFGFASGSGAAKLGRHRPNGPNPDAFMSKSPEAIIDDFEARRAVRERWARRRWWYRISDTVDLTLAFIGLCVPHEAVVMRTVGIVALFSFLGTVAWRQWTFEDRLRELAAKPAESG